MKLVDENYQKVMDDLKDFVATTAKASRALVINIKQGVSGEGDSIKIDDVNEMELDSDEEVGSDVDEAEEGGDFQSLPSIYRNIEGGSESDDDERRQSFEATEQRIDS